jgi:hypothetical protein
MAALSGSEAKAPGFAGGWLLFHKSLRRCLAIGISLADACRPLRVGVEHRARSLGEWLMISRILAEAACCASTSSRSKLFLAMPVTVQGAVTWRPQPALGSAGPFRRPAPERPARPSWARSELSEVANRPPRALGEPHVALGWHVARFFGLGLGALGLGGKRTRAPPRRVWRDHRLLVAIPASAASANSCGDPSRRRVSRVRGQTK